MGTQDQEKIESGRCHPAENVKLAKGPFCFHNEPTVLRSLNEMNVYVCSRYPKHHCRWWCPADALPVDDSNRTTNLPAVSLDSPPSSSREAFPLSREESEEFVGTPSSQEISSFQLTATAPAAPTKSLPPFKSSSLLRTVNNSHTVRSLTPIFNGFAPALNRANLLGGRFVQIRAGSPAQAAARMQRPLTSMETTTTIPSILNNTTNKSGKIKKRTRHQSSTTISVQTVSRGQETRQRHRGGAANRRL